MQRMSQEANTYVLSHQLLSNWNDELEYLGYILAEIVDPHGLDVRGFMWHQAADLPTIEDALKQAANATDSRLRAVLRIGTRRKLIRLMSKSREIRNAVAHHQAPCEQKMREMRLTKDKLSGQLQSIIRSVASTFNIDHVQTLLPNPAGRAVGSVH
ncbi:uncharacterized protein BJX67DRAFT_361542 [Aspergillus lucknowensis]|uniref:Uncharacterized protein n=1 Tax=Aspergillus lucknowensis TaxID=176173 RepID=A0ABR4LIL8_9EURO